MLTYLLILGLLGLIFGSFCNAYIYRYIGGDSVWRGRSRCPHCGKELGPLELIPLFSFLWLRGRCRHCRKPIAWQYPLVEAVTGLLFIGAGLFVGPFSTSLSYLVPLGIYAYLIIAAVIVAVVDLRIQIIPDRVILPAMVVAALLHLAQVYFGESSVSDCWIILATAFASGGALWLIAILAERIVKKEAMGGGDIKLMFLLGLIVGWPGILVTVLVGFWSGAIVGIALIAFGGRKLADRIPFGPYLLLGGIVGYVWGQKLISLFTRGILS